MNPRTLSLLALSASILLLLNACASRVAAYSGGRRSPGQVALLPAFEAQREIRILSVDGCRITNPRADIEMLPGVRTIELIYTPPRTAHSYPVRITFRAEAGHSYALSAKVLHGRDAGAGYWEGKYQAFVYDLNPVHEVGRSEGPLAPRPKRIAD